MILDTKIQQCTRCPLHKDMPEGCLPVPGIGPKDSKLMIVGEALGENEAVQQEPFVGISGQLLTKILRQADIDREKCYITNTVKCRPTTNGGRKNRPPSDVEIFRCKIWLWKEILLVKPSVIVTLGRIPTYTLLNQKLKKTFKLSLVVGTKYSVDYCKSVIIPCYHPSYLLQHGRNKFNESIDILKLARETINE